MRVVIVGGAEAWLKANELAAANVSVVLRPVMCTPEAYDARRCRSLTSLEHPMFHQQQQVVDMNSLQTSISILHDAGVKLAVTSEDDNWVHDLVWLAGWTRWMSNRRVDGSLMETQAMSLHEAVGLVTWNVADILGIDKTLRHGELTNATVFTSAVMYANGHPLKTTLAPLALSLVPTSQNRVILRCNPKQI
jgi:hypothetical protein